MLFVHDGRDDDQLQGLQRVNRDESVDLPVFFTITCHADTLVRKKYIKDQEDVEAQKHEKVAIEASLGRDRLANADEEAVEEDGANDRANHRLYQVAEDQSSVLEDEEFDKDEYQDLHKQSKRIEIRRVREDILVAAYLSELCIENELIEVETSRSTPQILDATDEEIREAKRCQDAKPLPEELDSQVPPKQLIVVLDDAPIALEIRQFINIVHPVLVKLYWLKTFHFCFV